MSKALVIVESPTKAKTIKQFLPKGYDVISSMGHIRDLPSSAKEIPAKYKGNKWAAMGVDITNDFEPLYVIPDKKKKLVKELKEKLAKADELILATDEDREGEAISWHLLEVLKPKVKVKRMVFHEITKEAITEALTQFRDLDSNLVNAQEGRRILDRLVGYTISPVLWKKIAPKLSAGRVQSAAVELLVARERERMRFVQASYWDLLADLAKDKAQFKAQLFEVDKEKVATGADFDKETGQLQKNKKAKILNEKEAKQLVKDLEKADWKVENVETKEQFSRPSPPFITSTLQQEAGRKLGWPAKQTMRTAQSLYEQGFITYMRTDSVNLSNQAINAARKCVESKYGKTYLSKEVRRYKTKSKGAQEAHEAIRPAGTTFRDPNKTGLSGPEFALYDLIWKRTVATQMAEAKVQYTQADISATTKKVSTVFRAKGRYVEFDGYFKAYVEGRDQGENAEKDEELPALKVGDSLNCEEITPLGHETKPPSRYTEAALIKALEQEGVGRPSTYATVISTIQDRGYVNKVNNALVPTFTAFAVTQLLEKYFPDLVDLKFTAQMEEQLDQIAEGKLGWQKYLKTYYLDKNGLQPQVEKVEDKIDPTEARKLDIPVAKTLKIDVLVGRFGPYLKKDGKEEQSASIPESYAPSDLNEELVQKIFALAGGKDGKSDGKELGKDPETGATIYLKVGRYGPYVQLGEVTDENPKPKRGAVLKGMNWEELTLAEAVKLLTLPRTLGVHPKTGLEVKASVGRFGPYVVHDGDFRSLKKDDNVLDIGLDYALELLAAEKKGRGGRGGGQAAVKTLGEMPGKKKDEIKVMNGRYGHYLKCGKLNVALPKDKDWETLTLAEAIELVKAKKK